MSSAIASPCVQICQLNEQQVCTGCGRSLSEIADWLYASDARKADIVAAASQRLRTLHPSTTAQRESQHAGAKNPA